VGFRRVVTGHDEQGRAIFVSDSDVAATTLTLTNTTYHELWRSDTPPSFPDAGTNGPQTTFFPPLGGYRFFILTMPPGDGHPSFEGIDIEAAIRETDEKLPGVRDWSAPDGHGRPGDRAVGRVHPRAR
jgi:hypothetical protein